MNSVRIAVSNSGPLIHLAKAGLIDFLFKLYDEVLIPESVYDEVVIKGKEEGHSDAIIIEQAITDKKIEVKKVLESNEEYNSSKLHQGEIDAVKLVLKSKSQIILLDDEEARIFARSLKLNVKGTLGSLLDFVLKGYIDVKNALKYLRELNSIMYLSSDVYNLIEDELKKLNMKVN